MLNFNNYFNKINNNYLILLIKESKKTYWLISASIQQTY